MARTWGMIAKFQEKEILQLWPENEYRATKQFVRAVS